MSFQSGLSRYAGVPHLAHPMCLHCALMPTRAGGLTSRVLPDAVLSDPGCRCRRPLPTQDPGLAPQEQPGAGLGRRVVLTRWFRCVGGAAPHTPHHCGADDARDVVLGAGAHGALGCCSPQSHRLAGHRHTALGGWVQPSVPNSDNTSSVTHRPMYSDNAPSVCAPFHQQ